MTEKQALALLKPMITACENGATLPWRKEWRDIAVSGGLPANLFRRKEYRGINTLVLLCEAENKGYRTNWWMTFKQAKLLGGSVRKGEKGTWVVFWKFSTEEVEDSDGQTRQQQRVLCRCYNVFNLDQCEGIDSPAITEIETLPEIERIQRCEDVVEGFTGGPDIRTVGNQPLYSPVGDYVAMPQAGQFNGPEVYYATLFHELVHSTGHSSRLNRSDLATYRTGAIQRNREELTAEMGSQLLCHHCQIALAPLEENSAAYCASWGKRLREKPVEFVEAAQRARKAADWILGKRPQRNDNEVDYRQELACAA